MLGLAAPEVWWHSLLGLGFYSTLASLFVVAGAGGPMVLAGVGLFFLTVALASVDRVGPATASGAAGLVFVALGIGLTQGTVPASAVSGIGVAGAGLAMIVCGAIGARLSRRARKDPARSTVAS